MMKDNSMSTILTKGAIRYLILFISYKTPFKKVKIVLIETINNQKEKKIIKTNFKQVYIFLIEKTLIILIIDLNNFELFTKKKKNCDLISFLIICQSTININIENKWSSSFF